MSVATVSTGDTLRAVGVMLVATAVLAVSDTLVRLTTEGMPIGEFLVLRGTLSASIFLAIVSLWNRPRSWWDLLRPLIVLRAVLEAGSVVLYIAALQVLLLAEVTAIYLASPLITSAVLAAFVLERVTWRRWTALIGGFCGVLLIMAPDLSSIQPAMLLALGSAGFVALRDIVTRRTPAIVRSPQITLCTTAAVALSGFLLLPMESDWVMPSDEQLALLVLASLFGSLGNLLAVVAFRSGEVSVVSLFRYASLPYALAIGLLVWGEVPSPVQLLGGVILCLSGMFVLSRRARATPIAAP